MGNRKRAGNPDIGKFFRDVRLLSGYGEGKLYAFADEIGIAGPHLQRIEEGKRLPGPEVMVRILKAAKKVNGIEPRRLLYLWLEGHGMNDWIAEIKGRRR